MAIFDQRGQVVGEQHQPHGESIDDMLQDLKDSLASLATENRDLRDIRSCEKNTMNLMVKAMSLVGEKTELLRENLYLKRKLAMMERKMEG